jgi:hypothetical protein
VASGRDGFIVRILRAWKMVVLMRGLGEVTAQYGLQQMPDEPVASPAAAVPAETL